MCGCGVVVAWLWRGCGVVVAWLWNSSRSRGMIVWSGASLIGQFCNLINSGWKSVTSIDDACVLGSLV